ncbi:ABC transporter ATP-binding protein [Algisphaera agarilytica]|uniref:ABC-type multidrug transport system fused ATPase/permease subunit n=1 Tax=Algisphaera agarilytica TaxID=1385975 RepID=A0A7X0H7L1_9BACT|nr:ABC transporter ATP-binding protein [Algisphaera agarilytica]MBB6430588.1 ABC-type multidrug transport system fused ATPase/permease subunit [Algisphaera agarilytica]
MTGVYRGCASLREVLYTIGSYCPADAGARPRADAVKTFWLFARQMLRYRKLLVIAMIAALLDTASATAGFAMLMQIIDLLIGNQQGLQEAAREFLQAPDTIRRLGGDYSHWADRLPSDGFKSFLYAILFILPLALFGSTMRYTHQALAITVGVRVVTRIRQQAFFNILHLPIETSEDLRSADSLSRLVGDTGQLGKGFNTLMGKAVRDVLMGFAFLLFALYVDWKLTGIFLIGLPIIGVAIKKFGKRIRRATKYTLREYANMIGAVQESIQHPSVVRLHNAEGYERRRFNTINRSLEKQIFRARTAKALSSPVIELISLVGVMGVSLAAAWYVFNGQGNPTDMVKVLVLLGMAGNSVRPLANLNNDLQEAGAAAVRIKEVLDAEPEPNTREYHKAETNPVLPRHHQDIVFESVSYRYPGSEEFAVSHLDLRVVHGQSVAIVGTNGSGKSTLLNLVPRLTNPTQGRVLIDGTDIATVSLRSLRHQISAVTQHSVMFAGTIADNIAYGRRDTPREDIIAAAQASFADEFVNELPDGYDTVLGEGGSGLSGGQRQRLCIARAILRDPAILILDEATSQIDAESEARITAAINEARAGRTTLIIAHRLSTVVDCDNIVVMDDGQIVDQGKHDQLLERCPIYQTLVHNQLTG